MPVCRINGAISISSDLNLPSNSEVNGRPADGISALPVSVA